MKKFEYKVITEVINYELESRCNSLGDEGWELVSVVCAGHQFFYYFKREKS